MNEPKKVHFSNISTLLLLFLFLSLLMWLLSDELSRTLLNTNPYILLDVRLKNMYCILYLIISIILIIKLITSVRLYFIEV